MYDNLYNCLVPWVSSKPAGGPGVPAFASKRVPEIWRIQESAKTVRVRSKNTNSPRLWLSGLLLSGFLGSQKELGLFKGFKTRSKDATRGSWPYY